MIPEWDTNFLYFSKLLPTEYPKFWEDLEDVLNKAQVNFGFLPNTKDIWCRDFMPIQVDENSFVQFRYDPDYLKDNENLKTDPLVVTSQLGITCKHSDIILDGGNLIYSERAAILTDKVFSENKSYSKKELLKELSQLLGTDEIYIIPKQPYDDYGHADGMVRFIDNNTLLINDFSRESKSFRTKLDKALKNTPFDLIFLEITFEHELNWGYINYIHIGSNIVIPTIKHPKEDKVLYQFEEIFKGLKIWTVYAKEILNKEGGLHCISWNVKRL